jgi:multiple sugar transport system permease protein
MAVEAQQAAAPVRAPRRGLSKKQLKGTLRSVLTHAALIPAAFLFMLPFLWMLSTSLKSKTQLYVYPPILVPIPPAWSNYPDAVNYIDFFLYLRNTLIIAFAATFGELIACSLVAYSLAWPASPGRGATSSSS